MSPSDRTTQGLQAQRITVAVRGSEVAIVSLSAAGFPVEKHVMTSRATWREVVAIVSKVALAVEYIHTHADSRLHGTLRSTDIVIQDNGGCVVCDFCEAARESLSTYSAPEQLADVPLDQRTDIYRLGVVFYKLLTRREPFRASDSELLRTQICDDLPQPPRQLVHGLPKELDSICLQMLAKTPADRIGSGKQLAEALQGILRQFDEPSERRSTVSTNAVAPRHDLVIIHIKSASQVDFASYDDAKELLSEFHASPVAWDGDGLLLHLTNTVSHDDAIGRVVMIAARLLQFMYGLAQQTSIGYRLRIESAEFDFASVLSPGASELCRSSNLVRRVPRVVGDVTSEKVEIDQASWQSLRRWVEHTESSNVAEVRASADSDLTRIHIRSAEPAGETFGPASPLAIVKARWAQAREGLGQMLLIIGEEGTGKSRLVAEVVRWIEQTEEPEVVIWNCIPRQQGRSFHPLARSLRHQLARVAADAGEPQRDGVMQYLSGIGETSNESAACLSVVVEAEESAFTDASRHISSVHKEGIHDLLLRWLGHTTKRSPVLFIVEDLQWADPATLDLINRLAADRLYEHLLLIATFRPEFETLWGSRAHQTQVTLRRLTEKHFKFMIQKRLTTERVDELVVQDVIRATGGVPLFIEAYLNRLSSEGK
jgi:AAA ATPase domain/Protein kinase domain